MNNLDKMIDCINTDYVCIQTHQFPDPDAIGCAYALHELLEHFQISSEVYYSGMIDKGDNAKMVEYLGLNMKNTNEAELRISPYTIIYVDSQAGNGNSSALMGKGSLCIDHHQKYNDEVYDFEDIRSHYGACATIIAQYYLENNIQISEKAATGLLYGIQIDTNNFLRKTAPEDIDAFQKLFPLCNHEFLNEIHNSRYDRKGIEAYVHSFNHMEFHDEICFVDVGKECPDNLAAMIADFVLAIEGVNLALVYTMRKDRIKFSMRSVSIKYDTGILMYGILHGLGSGGGHAMMSGGFIPYKENMDVNTVIRKVKDKLIWLMERICE